ncbi:MAG: glutathione S-transferase C-terminal domain-containing protein [Oceanicaulis sp.]
MRSYTLITAPDVPACHMARAYLRWRNIPFVEKPATVLVARAEIRPRLRTIGAPLLVSSDQDAWDDTRDMADRLDDGASGDPLRPRSIAARFACDLIEAWADQRLAPAAAFLLWVTEPDAASSRLANTAWPDDGGPQPRRTARLIGRRLVRQLEEYGFEMSGRAAVEDQMRAALSAAEEALCASHFLFGARPTTADCALFGVVQTLKASEVGRTLLAEHPRLKAWEARVAGPDDPGRGALRRVSSNPVASLSLQRMAARAFLPEALEASEAVARWAADNPGHLVLPRSVGRASDSERRLRPADAWLVARLRGLLGPVETVEDAETFRLLKALGLLALRDFQPRRRIVRRHHRLELDMADAGEPGEAGGDARSAGAVRQVRDSLEDAERAAAEVGEIADLVSG